MTSTLRRSAAVVATLAAVLAGCNVEDGDTDADTETETEDLTEGEADED